jgi:hypothetical protein
MIIGHPGPDFRCGIWNCTSVWPMVICGGVATAGWPAVLRGPALTGS